MEKDFTRFVGIAVPTAFLCSILYSWLYWGAVNIDPFEFISLEDIVTRSIPVLLISTLALAPTALLNLWSKKKADPVPSDADLRAMARFMVTVVVAVWILAFLCIVYLSHTPNWIFTFATGLMAIAGISLGSILTWKKFFNVKPIGQAVGLFLAALPVFMMANAREDANDILQNRNAKYVESRNLKDFQQSDENRRMLYYGKLGDWIFFVVEGELRGYSGDSFKQLIFKREARKKKWLFFDDKTMKKSTS